MTALSFFFFQAEDGIRDKLVTGVQTCALPISVPTGAWTSATAPAGEELDALVHAPVGTGAVALADGCETLLDGAGERGIIVTHRSEERRVGKECRSRVAADHSKSMRRLEHMTA